MKKLLHLNAYYSDTTLYRDIITRLDGKWEQFVYVPSVIGLEHKNYTNLSTGRICYSDIIGKWDRYLYFHKISKIFKDYQAISFNPDFIHAHNLFTDGVIAYKIHKTNKCKYIVSIRMTDLYLQYKYMFHRRGIANKALWNASAVVFLSDIHREDLLKYIKSPKLREEVKRKSYIIPNGLGQYWFDNIVSLQRDSVDTECINLLHIGRIVKYKNILRTIDAIENLIRKNIQVRLTIIGGSFSNELDFYEHFKKIIKDKQYITYLGAINDKDVIRDYYRQADALVVASINELFGLIYLEAISQNVPVIFGEGSGIESYLKDKGFAVGVNPYDVSSIEEGIMEMISRKESLSVFSHFVNDFKWDHIVERLNCLYNE